MKDYSFGNYICALRTGLGLSQFQLGTLVGVSDKAVSKWENGDAMPRVGTCHRLAAVLGVSINELLSCKQEITIPARKELEKMNSELWKEAYRHLSIYGEHPPAACLSRLASEEAALSATDAIQGFALMGQLQEEARKHNTIVLASGPVNSSFAAWLFGGTLVNPMPAHYRCPACGCTEFVADVNDGFDLPPKRCACGAELIRDGHNIPFQGYAKTEQRGTNLELRVSSGFLPRAVSILKEFYDGVAQILPVRLLSDGEAYIDRYIILPENKARPALSEDGFWRCSGEEYWQWQSGETSYMFLPVKTLDVLEEQMGKTGASIPEPQTLITPQMVHSLYQSRSKQLPQIAKPITEQKCTFDLLVRIDSMTHSSFKQNPNVRFRSVPFADLPATREDIWINVRDALAAGGVRDDGFALLVMETCRKGLYHSRGIPDGHRKLFCSLGLPEWYPDYLENTMYLFPKGHCIAYLLIDALMHHCSHT